MIYEINILQALWSIGIWVSSKNNGIENEERGENPLLSRSRDGNENPIEVTVPIYRDGKTG